MSARRLSAVQGRGTWHILSPDHDSLQPSAAAQSAKPRACKGQKQGSLMHHARVWDCFGALTSVPCTRTIRMLSPGRTPRYRGDTHTHSLPRGSTVHVHAPKPASHNSRLPHMRVALGTPWVPMMCIFPLPSVQTVSSVSAELRRLHTLEQEVCGTGYTQPLL